MINSTTAKWLFIVCVGALITPSMFADAKDDFRCQLVGGCGGGPEAPQLKDTEDKDYDLAGSGDSFLSGLQGVLGSGTQGFVGQTSVFLQARGLGFLPQYDHNTESDKEEDCYKKGGGGRCSLRGLMENLANNMQSGKGNRWGADTLSVATVTDSSGSSGSSGSSATMGPAEKVRKVAMSVYPIYKETSTNSGRYQVSSACDFDNEDHKVTNVPDKVVKICHYTQIIKYGQLLTHSCQSSWHAGPSIQSTSDIGKACGSNFPVAGSGSDQSEDNSDATQFTVPQGMFQGCSATLCGNGTGTALHQTKRAQLLNGWSDTCQSLKNFTSYNCDDLKDSKDKDTKKLNKQCWCMRKYLYGDGAVINDCKDLEGEFSSPSCASLKSGGAGNYSRGCPPVGQDFNSPGSEAIGIATKANSDMTRVQACFSEMFATASKAMMSQLWKDAKGQSNGAESFGTIYTLLGPDQYGSDLTDRSVSDSLIQENPDFDTTSPRKYYEKVDNEASMFAELMIAMVTGSVAKTPSMAVLPKLQSSGTNTNFLRNGRFIQVNSSGVVQGDTSSSGSNQSTTLELKGKGSDVSTIQDNQKKAEAKAIGASKAYEVGEQANSKMQLLVLSMFYELFAQRALTIPLPHSPSLFTLFPRAYTPQEIRKASAVWRLDPTVTFYNKKGTWGRCSSGDYTKKECDSWATIIAGGDVSLVDLLSETTNILAGVYSLQYEIFQQQSRIALLQALYATNVVMGKNTTAQSEKNSIDQMAQIIYSGDATTSFSQGVSGYSGSVQQ